MIAVAPLVITLILSTLTVSAPAGAIDPEAKQHLERGLAGYTAKDYAGAIKDLRLAYALDPRPEILFAWAQAERLYGRCSQASKLYDRFLKSKPSAQQAAAARTGIERCEGQPDTTPADPEDVEQPAPQPAQEQPEQPAAAAALLPLRAPASTRSASACSASAWRSGRSAAACSAPASARPSSSATSPPTTNTPTAAARSAPCGSPVVCSPASVEP
jgi:tetratricopeptide (TPR) repeat protein